MPFQLPTLLVSPLTLTGRLASPCFPATGPLLHGFITSPSHFTLAVFISYCAQTQLSGPGPLSTGLAENRQDGATQDLSDSMLSYC